MKGEIPVFKRCCFCLPLRYGLLAWGYFKVIADALILIVMSYGLITTLIMMAMFGAMKHMSQIYIHVIIAVIAIAIFFADFIVTIIFIVAGHNKNVKLIRVFYFLSIGMWIMTVLLTTVHVGLTISSIFTYNRMFIWEYALMSFSFFFVVIVVQSYVLLLLRSEIIKLRNQGEEYRFVNIAAEAECSMESDEKQAREQTVPVMEEV